MIFFTRRHTSTHPQRDDDDDWPGKVEEIMQMHYICSRAANKTPPAAAAAAAAYCSVKGVLPADSDRINETQRIIKFFPRYCTARHHLPHRCCRRYLLVGCSRERVRGFGNLFDCYLFGRFLAPTIITVTVPTHPTIMQWMWWCRGAELFLICVRSPSRPEGGFCFLRTSTCLTSKYENAHNLQRFSSRLLLLSDAV